MIYNNISLDILWIYNKTSVKWQEKNSLDKSYIGFVKDIKN
jgi:hypothetical protein